MQLKVKTLLNRIQHFGGFVYHDIRLGYHRHDLCLEVRIEPHRGLRGKCSACLQPAPGYDRLPERQWLFVPPWGIQTYFLYPPRRVECPQHGVVVEHIPWSEGKRPVTKAMMGFLARWASAPVLATDRPVFSDQLGSGLSLGRVVCAVGLGPAPLGGSPVHWCR